MRKFSRERNQKALINTKTNASRVDFEIKDEPKTMLTIEDKLELRNIANKIQEESLAFQGTADCLKNKLHAIWKTAIEFIVKIEREYTHKLLESLIQIDAFYAGEKNPRIREFALSLEESEIKKLNDIRARYYFLTLRDIYRIGHIYDAFYEGNNGFTSPFNEDFKECFFVDENFKSGKFINLMVQEFFSLSINAYELSKVCGIRVGGTLSKDVRDYRSDDASKKQKALKYLEIIKSSNGLTSEAKEAAEELEDIFDPYGEEVLIDRIKEIIPKLSPKSNCKSALSIINDNEKLFDDILDEYKEVLGSPIVKNGRRLTYEKNLDKPGLAILINKHKLFSQIKAQIKKSSETDRLNKAS
ncbi:hypothetical protein N5D77_14315 [Comamonas thiooxydans]|uniref:Uncharacterized protein n=1 Tax=Comamonas thiooxydans TaxID=363952 RepID=A0AA42PZU7_9BURK|nr:hypothetical protein [Comamonas thiooxydans]MDH1334555.1 hypothetical protein [Comamonas thiooxydans]MDH1740515.1 hypothetical protein [Comamonas thiooxydans]MDH1787740.1 hypothetical protein [Comamonas thiooxydans]